MKSSPLGWALIQSDWCPCTRGKSGHMEDTPEVCAQRKDHGQTQQEGGHLQADERGLSLRTGFPTRRQQTCQHLNLGIPEL